MLRLYQQAGWRPGLRQLVTLPPYHAAGLIPALIGSLDGHRLTVAGRRFDPDEVLDIVSGGWLVEVSR